jgi:hypothetical protein
VVVLNQHSARATQGISLRRTGTGKLPGIWNRRVTTPIWFFRQDRNNEETMQIGKKHRLVGALFVTALTAFGGTVSPQILSGDPNRPVEVIVQYTPTLIGRLLSPVCGVLNLVELLPLGELCSMTASAAAGLANNPNVAHVSVNNVLEGTATPAYDYMPQSVQPSSAPGAPNSSYGAAAFT